MGLWVFTVNAFQLCLWVEIFFIISVLGLLDSESRVPQTQQGKEWEGRLESGALTCVLIHDHV